MKSETAPLAELPRMLAEELIRKIVLEAFQVAEARNTILLDDEDGTIDEPAEDAINVMLGDDFGCLDPDDPDDAAMIFKFRGGVESVIRRAMLEFAEQAEKAVYELPSFHRNGEFNSVEMRNMAAAAIRELAEGLKK